MSGTVHFATTETVHAPFEVWFENERIADADQAVELREYYEGKAMAPVYYFTQELVNDLQLRTSGHTTFCPIKGETRYWHFRHIDNAIWSYPDPLESVAAIRGRVAFDIASGFRIERGEL